MRDLIQATANKFESIREVLTQTIKNKYKDRYDNQLYYVPKNLLGTGSAKTIKGQKKGWTTYVLYMSPYRFNSKGINLCPKATKGCAKSCLFTSGRGSFQSVEIARLNKTEYYINDKQKFMDHLVKDIQAIVKRHEKLIDDVKNENGSFKINKKFAIRLNGTTDINWSLNTIDSQGGKNIFEVFPNVQFYDYTKVTSIMENQVPNHFVTYSLSEHNKKVAEKFLNSGKTIASVYYPTIPKQHLGHKVYDGDESDLIFTYQDLKGKDSLNIGLYLKVPVKTKQKVNNFIRESLESGFVHLVSQGEVIETTHENIERVLIENGVLEYA